MENTPFKYQALFDSNMIGVAATDFNDTILNANTAFLQMIGYTAEDLTNGTLRWSTISPEQYNEADEKKLTELLAHKSIIPFEKEYIHKKGYVIPVLVGAEALEGDARFGVCFALDISTLKENEKRKEAFAAMVSHELRTPLSIIKLSTDILTTLIERGTNTEELIATTEEINLQIDKLNVLITDVLNMSIYHSDDPAFSMSGVDVYETTMRVVQELSIVHNREITFEGEEHVFIQGNVDRLSQVLINLIANAIRYSPVASNINVSLRADTNSIFLSIQDFGIGIASENLEKIFVRFYRINHKDKHKDIGTGIGLYICNEIIKRHRGTLTVSSEIGKGSTFTIEIPRLF